MKPVFFIDYDNTIFSHQTWSIPESSLEALIRLHEDGYKIALASGRAFRSDSLPEEFHGRFAPDCLVSSNGAIIEIEGKLIHEKFFRNLRERYPSLTATDLRFCALLRLNLSTKDIAQMTNLTIRGVEAARYRLRKKLDIPDGTGLVDFLIDLK